MEHGQRVLLVAGVISMWTYIRKLCCPETDKATGVVQLNEGNYMTKYMSLLFNLAETYHWKLAQNCNRFIRTNYSHIPVRANFSLPPHNDGLDIRSTVCECVFNVLKWMEKWLTHSKCSCKWNETYNKNAQVQNWLNQPHTHTHIYGTPTWIKYYCAQTCGFDPELCEC